MTDTKMSKNYKDREWLERKYVVEDLTISEIADIEDVSDSSIHYQCQKFDIDTSASSDIEKEWLEEKYYGEGMSMKGIGELVNLSRCTIEYHMNKFGLDRRKSYETVSANEKYTEKDWLHKKYVEEELSTIEMAEICGCSPPTILRHLKDNNISIRSNSGSDHYNWKGGRSETPHSSLWDDVREKAISRDFNRCRSCRINRKEHKKKYGQDIEVHHKTPRSWFFEKYDEEMAHDKMNRMRNLITLCKSCHMQMERSIK